MDILCFTNSCGSFEYKNTSKKSYHKSQQKKEILEVGLYTMYFFTICDSKSTPLTLHLII